MRDISVSYASAEAKEHLESNEGDPEGCHCCWYRWQLLRSSSNRSKGYRNSKGKATAFLFQKLYPKEEFFPETPSLENLEDDIPINLED
ncbi:hypothetical protein L3X38_009109 [Prunus dulcis]|uniref:Uncharacterized protein n=1 Tax=Prunus dulcis TaxID=3755 RepID=A0AAD4ZXT0_PRUDU|nr:hypothetical protein L3X38_009109 [Prunus dulcis]